MSAAALAKIDPQSLIERIAEGAYLRDLAKETGIDKRRLSEALRKHPDYPAAKVSAIEVQLDDAQIALSVAQDKEDIARAREMFRAAAWRAEHEAPQVWGSRLELTGKDGKDLIPEQKPEDLARKVAFLLRKGIDAEDAQVIEGNAAVLTHDPSEP